jgi:hypothetical protein
VCAKKRDDTGVGERTNPGATANAKYAGSQSQRWRRRKVVCVNRLSTQAMLTLVHADSGVGVVIPNILPLKSASAAVETGVGCQVQHEPMTRG